MSKFNIQNHIANLNSKKNERPGREIKISGKHLGNNNISLKIGTIDNKNCPDTVYIFISFWIDIKNRALQERLYNESTNFYTNDNFDTQISKHLKKEILNVYKNDLRDILDNNAYFPRKYENNFTFDFPENINYNKKKSFVNIELHLTTLNIFLDSNDKLPLKNKKNSALFNELISIAEVIANCDLLKGKKDFTIFNTKG